MRRIVLLSLSLALLGGAPAQALDAKGPLLCALVDVYDCSPGDCTEVESESVAVPDVLRIDPEKKTASALDVEFEGASSPLDTVTTEGGKIVARGKQRERALVVSIEVATGDGTVTVTDPKTTLVIYAECVEP
jgi:hypothetical protein